MAVSLLRRGALVVPPGTSSTKAQEMTNSIPVEYIVKQIATMQVTSAGSRVWIIKAGTGTGKSTTFPVSLIARGKRIAVTQPQRLTAEEIPYGVCEWAKDFKMGENIGFQTGLVNKAPPKGIVYMTTGILRMHMLLYDAEKFMRRYSTIMIDEVHKHDLQTDVLLRLLKQFLQKNWNNKECPVVMLMSGTMVPQKYMDYFETTNFIEVNAVSYPITPHWPSATIGDTTQYVTSLCKDLSGDTLIFLPGARSITDIGKALTAMDDSMVVIEVMGKNIASGEIKQMMTTSNKKRIVLATNAAETGLTLPFLMNVIDTGLVNTVAFNPQYNCTCIALQAVAQSSAIQRRGRVGRKTPGDWYPLFTEETFNNMIVNNYAEIYTNDYTADLLTLIVTLTESTIEDKKVTTLVDFDPATIGLIHDPSSESLSFCYDKLYQLGMIEQNWRPTITGVLTTKFNKISLESSKMILSAPYYGANIMYLVIIAACQSVGVGKIKAFSEDETFKNITKCDFITLLIVYEQLQRRIQKMSTKNLSTNWIREWCESNELIYEVWLAVIEAVYMLLFQLMTNGLRVNVASIPLLDSLELDDKTEALSEIRKIKQCIYEGYRFNTASWNDRSQSYITHFKSNKLVIRDQLEYTNILTDAIVYRNTGGEMNFTIGDLVCGLDDHITLDTHYMY